ncbi:MAG: hypothetical protein RL172_260 [Bacteroidota bacterium]
MKALKSAILISSLLFFAFCNNASTKKNGSENATENAKLSDEEILKIAHDAYVFGYPLIIMDYTKKVGTNVEVVNPMGAYAPVNQIAHNRDFPDHNFTKVVKPNCDTYYSSAWFDLKAEPMLLSAPATDRFYLLPLIDAYSNVFASPGTRTTGKTAHTFLIAGPGWKGQTPEGAELIQAPTNMVWMIGRTQVNSAADGKTVVRKIQDGFKAIPLSATGKNYIPAKGVIVPEYEKLEPVKATSSLSTAEYFNRMSELMVDNPPAAADEPMVKLMATIGLQAGKPFTTDGMSDSLKEKLNKIPQQFIGELKAMAATKDPSKIKDGWKYITKPIGNFGTDYSFRALVAFGGLGANIPEDAVYPTTMYDSEGNQLNADNNYVLHFTKEGIPPVNAFWSLTMYDDRNLLTDNPIRRYAIGDRDKLKYNADGSLDLFIQKASPGKDKESNWLPAPQKGTFETTLRLYWPKESAINRTWSPPVLTNTSKK